MMDLRNYKQRLLETYDLEIDRIIKEIKKNKAKLVCLQFPEGLKAISPEIAIEIEKKTNSKVLIWLDTCFGACDTPLGLDTLGNQRFPGPRKSKTFSRELGVDILIQFGHAPWDERNK